jgi:hypothetical protein
LEGGGLLRKDLTPKEVYHRSRRLIRDEWRTQFEGITDDRGTVKLRGFHGRYKAVIEKGEVRKETAFELSPGKPVELTVIVSDQ